MPVYVGIVLRLVFRQAPKLLGFGVRGVGVGFPFFVEGSLRLQGFTDSGDLQSFYYILYNDYVLSTL